MKERDTGLDLLRVLSMCGIVGLHVLGQGGILGSLDKVFPFAFGFGLEALFLCSVNIFAILSGYFYGLRRFEGFKNRNIVRLILTVLFYCLLITVLFVLFSDIPLGAKDLLFAVFPPLKERYWYITNYVFLFFLMPYINRLTQQLPQRLFHNLLFVLFAFGVMITTFGIRDYFVLNKGYSVLWLAICYLIGVYIRTYGLPFCLQLKAWGSMALIAVNTALVVLSIYVLRPFAPTLDPQMFLQYNSPFIVVNSILLFGLFKDNSKLANIKSSKIVVMLSTAAFDVYIIHCHILIFDYVLENHFVSFAALNPFAMVGAVLLTIVGVYFFCFIIAEARMWVFRVIGLNRLSDTIGEKMDRCLLES